MTLDLDASDKLLAYFPRTDDAKEASLMIPREKIPCPLACVLGFAASEREERLERLPIIEGVTMRMVWNSLFIGETRCIRANHRCWYL